jgi:hypothetical protein
MKVDKEFHEIAGSAMELPLQTSFSYSSYYYSSSIPVALTWSIGHL